MAFEIRVSPGVGSPIFRQIVDQVRLAVSVGQLKEGEALPSVRVLAEQLLVNPNTVARAYTELVNEGVIETQVGRGVFVGKIRQIYTRAERLRRLEPLADALVTEALSLGFDEAELLDTIRARRQQILKPNEPKNDSASEGGKRP